MSLDPAYITNTSLNQYFVDKDSGEPLSGGKVYFYRDASRTTPKLVYRLSGSPPDYTYTALPNPITLSAVGTVQDGSNNNVSIYYYPYIENEEGELELDLYYIRVTDSLGVEQFTREAWPNDAEINSVALENNEVDNQISNPQFVDILFDNTITLSFSGSSTDVVTIAPDWDLTVAHTGNCTVTITRNPIAGSAQYPTNPPYTMTFLASTNITNLWLTQRLLNAPDIWSPATGASGGYVSTGVMLETGSGVTIQYVTSNSTVQTLFTDTNNTGLPEFTSQTVQLNPASNSDTGATGYIDIRIVLKNLGTTTLSSIQVVPLNAEEDNIGFAQITPSRQRDHLFHYYNPLLEFKPIPSYLVGWDFPLNPAQFLGESVTAFATGNNTSNYVWDQTIAFQSKNSGLTFSRDTNAAFKVTAAVDGQFALIQYLDGNTVKEILQNNLSVNVLAFTDSADAITGTVSLWYTNASALPSMGSNQSIVATLDANGKPATFNNGTGGTWTEIGRSGLGNGTFTLPANGTECQDYGISGWALDDLTNVPTATYFAIVVGFSSLVSTKYIEVMSISLVPGKIPTRPAPKSAGEVLLQCQRYYEKSFNQGVVPAASVALDHGEQYSVQYLSTGTATQYMNYFFFKATKRTAGGGNYTFYSPVISGAQVYNLRSATACTSTTVSGNNDNGFWVQFTPAVASTVADRLAVQWVCDDRLGVVL